MIEQKPKDSRLSKLLDQNHISLMDLHRRSAGWFEFKVLGFRDVKNIREETLMRGDQANKSNRIIPGNMYLYIYEAKHAATLPYWDRFPLVFPFRAVDGGFYGINMHYLPYKYRAVLMDRLITIAGDRALTENTKLRLKWEAVSSFSQLAPAKVCVKHYLYSQVRSPFKRIIPEDWAAALFLPMERFQGASNQQVWTDTVRKLKAL